MRVIRKSVQLKSVVVLLPLLMGIAAISRAAQPDQVPPKELVQYIRDAKRRGIAEAKIKKQAVAVGWSAAAVDEAVAFEKTGKALPASPILPATTVAASPQTGSLSSNPAQEPAAVAAADALLAPSTGTPAAGAPPSGAPTARSDDYLIGSGDTLQVTVWNQPEVSVPSGVVRPDGRITVPLIKDVEVSGLTPRRAEAVIAEGLSKFFTDPNVTVVVASINSKKVYLIGAVRKEGTLPYTYGMTVMQALSEAGGLNDYAKRSKIYVLRTENGQEYRLEFNYQEVVKGRKMEQNIVLLPGDTVVVPQ